VCSFADRFFTVFIPADISTIRNQDVSGLKERTGGFCI